MIFFMLLKMSATSKVLPEEDSLLEIVIDVFYYLHCRKPDGYFDKKNKYVALRDKFVEKIRIKYPHMSDEEIFNFISIYLIYESIKNNYKSDFLFDGRIPVNRISFVGPYWKKKETISIDG